MRKIHANVTYVSYVEDNLKKISYSAQIACCLKKEKPQSSDRGFLGL